jgi:predicted nucleic acid-binding protein
LEPRSPRLPCRANQTNRINEDPSRNRIKGRKKKNKNRLHHPHQGGQRTPKLILDSNIIAKLVLNEPGSKEARANVTGFLKKGYTLYTVDLALAECLNVIWKHANLLSDLKAEDAKSAVEDLVKVYDGLNIITTREFTTETINTALTQNITAYDALYIATAQKVNGTLYTADQKLCTTANTTTNTKLLKPPN